MLRATVSQYFQSMQRNLFPGFAEELGVTTDKHLQVIIALDVIQVENFLPYQSSDGVGRPLSDRCALARAFVSKAVLNIPTTIGLIDRLKVKKWYRNLRAKWSMLQHYFEFRVTTALSEGINNVIKSVKRCAYGFRNMTYFKLKILQQCGLLRSDYYTEDGKLTPKARELLGVR